MHTGHDHREIGKQSEKQKEQLKVTEKTLLIRAVRVCGWVFLPVDLTVSKNLCVQTLHSHTKLFCSIYRFHIDKCASVAHNYQQKSRAHAHRLN